MGKDQFYKGGNAIYGQALKDKRHIWTRMNMDKHGLEIQGKNLDCKTKRQSFSGAAGRVFSIRNPHSALRILKALPPAPHF
jgi:hypothetical protein